MEKPRFPISHEFSDQDTVVYNSRPDGYKFINILWLEGIPFSLVLSADILEILVLAISMAFWVSPYKLTWNGDTRNKEENSGIT
jgi:hypothetical protein